MASSIFADSSYQGATIYEIAAQAGISEPIIYKYFSSKRDLYLVCLDLAMARFKEFAEGETGRDRLHGIAEQFLAMTEWGPARLMDMWIQALSVAQEDDVIAKAVRDQIREIHAFFSQLVREGQRDGSIALEHDPIAEAWVILANGLLATINGRLGGFLEADLGRVSQRRQRWLRSGTQVSARPRFLRRSRQPDSTRPGDGRAER